MFDLNDVEPIYSGELIPDGSFAKVTMTLRPGGIDGSTELDKALLKSSNSPGSDVLSLDCEFTVVEGPFAKRKFWQTFTVTGGKVDDKGASIGWNISKRIFRAMIELGARPRSRRHERGGQGETATPRARRSQRHHLCRQDRGRAEQGPPLPRPQPARSPRAAEREGMAGGDERRDRPATPIEATHRERWSQRSERTGAGVGRRATEAGGGTGDNRHAALAAFGRGFRTGFSAGAAAGRAAGKAGRACLAEWLTSAASAELCECR